jgi:hypothetical protein
MSEDRYLETADKFNQIFDHELERTTFDMGVI